MFAARKNKRPFKKIDTIRIDIAKEQRADGSILLYSKIELEPHPYRLTEKLKYWAEKTPHNIFIGRRNAGDNWQTLTYAETFGKVKSIAQALLQKNVSPTQPVAILSENSFEHALIALACLHIGVAYSPVAPAYSLKSTDFDKLRHVINLLTPGLIFVQDGEKYTKALEAIAKDIEVVSPVKPPR